MKFYVLIRENLKVPEGNPQRHLPVNAHWDREWLKKQESIDDETRFYVKQAITI